MKLVEPVNGGPVHVLCLKSCWRGEHMVSISKDKRIAICRHCRKIEACSCDFSFPKFFSGALLELAHTPSDPTHCAFLCHLGQGIRFITARINAAIRPQSCPTICKCFRVRCTLPQLRAIVETQSVEPATTVHEDHSVIVRKDTHDVPKARIWLITPQFVTIGSVYSNDPLGPYTYFFRPTFWKLVRYIHSCNDNSIVDRDHVTLFPQLLCHLSAPTSLPCFQVQRKHFSCWVTDGVQATA
mmetsp:Transcript_14458/g.25555  ORF Transcript_14458/g.25555 Transcript_14458/m.25555 type:complete len:241 (+) Transcript_14458:630-1352(+)